jgi:hypothetical protein
LQKETAFQKEHNNLEQFFQYQMSTYFAFLGETANKIEQKIVREFRPADWKFDTMTREWSSTVSIL